jgi:two-component system, NarL family, nitrate/nitrite response regulator NarL
VPLLLDSGARGVIPSTMSIRSVPNAIGLVHSGEIFVPVELRRAGTTAPRMPETEEGNGPPILTATDTLLLRQAAEGLTGREIARNLGMTEVSVKMHVRTICRKLGARNRTHAVVLARQIGLV